MSPLPRRPLISAYQLISGRRLLDRLDELNANSWRKREELETLQQRRLYSLLSYAYEYVPFYQETFREAHFRPEEVLTDLSSFQQLPVLTKKMIQDNPEALKTTEKSRRKHLKELSTSGSTGHPLVFMEDSNFRDYVTADWHRHLGFSGWKLGDPHCYIWGTLIEATESKTMRTRMMDWTLNRFITNAFALSDDRMCEFVAEIRRRRPRVIRAFPSTILRFARFVRENNLEDIKFDSIILGAEMVYPEQRRVAEEVFGGKVFNRYGSKEVGGVSCECQAHNGMHVSIDTNYVEIVRDGRQAKPGETGDIVITNLMNFGMPFIRYQIKDLGAWSTVDSCPCGRELPLMEMSQGRRLDIFRTRDGRFALAGGAAGRVAMYQMKNVKQFQFIQKTLDLVIARVVVTDPLTSDQMAEIEKAFQGDLGDNVKVQFEYLEDIPPMESGQYRFVISEVPDDIMSVSQ